MSFKILFCRKNNLKKAGEKAAFQQKSGLAFEKNRFSQKKS